MAIGRSQRKREMLMNCDMVNSDDVARSIGLVSSVGRAHDS